MVNYTNKQVQEDLAELVQENIPWQHLKDKTVLVTGATGMLASYLGFTLLYLNENFNLNIKILFLARSKKKLKTVYGAALEQAQCLVQDVCDSIKLEGSIDYIIHAAGAASPYYILNDPVGIINANVQGTQSVLELARFSNTKNIVFTSTREVYGQVLGKDFIKENDMGILDPLSPRNCYPESKRLAEALFMAYYKQYNICFNTLRIAHCYGPGMQIKGDGRVLSDFMNDAINARDIIMKSSGEAERAFCYISDAISGIFRVMLEGEPARAYNLSNENEPIRLIDLANLLQKVANNGKGVKIEPSNNQTAYTNYARTALDTELIQRLGWIAKISLGEGLARTLKSFQIGIKQCN